VLFTLATFILLVASTLLLYRELNTRLDWQDQRFFDDKVNVVRHILSVSPDPFVDLQREVRWRVAKTLTDYWVRVERGDGSILIQTPGMNKLMPPPAAFPPPSQPGTDLSEPTSWHVGRRPLALQSALGQIGPQHAPAKILLILDKSEDRNLTAAYRRKMGLILLLAMFVGLPLAAAIVRSGLGPVQQMALAADRISATRLSERMGGEPWPKELRRLAAAFDAMLERLEESFVRLEQFSSDLAHEFRTPLNNLMGEIEVGLRRRRDPEDYQQILASALEECSRMSRMIDNLLFLARSERTDRKIARAPLDLHREMTAVADFHEALAEQRRIEIRCVGDGEVTADAMLLRRALTNLVSNALQWTPPGGSVTLEAGRDDGGPIIRVSDTGSGIGAEHLPRIFDRFYRVDPARAGGREGTGLGLAIVRSIMELHEGSVTIDSKPGQGTTVTLHFP
jgi:two-component system, OmpR family, heavy metal sensor histidine kinase CusS